MKIPWDDDDDLGFDDEPISEPLSEVCGGVTTWDGFDLEGLPDDQAKNLRGQLYRHYDQSGMTTVPMYSFKGQPLGTEKQVLADYKAEVDWPDTGKDALLETEVFSSSTQYDALGRVTFQTNPDTSTVEPGYLQSGRLDTLSVKARGTSAAVPYVTGITYNAKGQRESRRGTSRSWTSGCSLLVLQPFIERPVSTLSTSRLFPIV